MMTAEPTINDGARLIRKIEACDGIAAKLVLLRQFADKYAAAQLAEKEREIEQSRQFAAQLESNIQFLNERVAAAEQRLQEAQADLKADDLDMSIIACEIGSCDATREDIVKRIRALRQREAELDELREHCVSEHECAFCQLPTREDAGRE